MVVGSDPAYLLFGSGFIWILLLLCGSLCKRRWYWKLKAVFRLLLDLSVVEGHLQFSSVAQSFPTLWPHGLQHARLPCPSPNSGACSNSCPSSQWCHPTISSSVISFSSYPQSFPASGSFPKSQFFEFSNESVLCIRWPKYWSLSFSICPSNEYSELISFRIDWFDLLEVQGTLKSLLEPHSSKVIILWHSGFFIVQLSCPYMTTGKTIALTIQTFVRKIMSLLFNTLPRLVIAFLPRSKCLLISWLQSLSAVILEPKKIKVYHCFHCFSIYFPWSDGTKCHNLR